MARCKECMHYDVCSKEGRMVQVDEHTWDYYNQLDDVERFCDNYIAAADVVPRAEVEREIFEEIEKHMFVIAPIEEFDGWARIQLADIMRLKKKYTQPEPPKGDAS